MTPGKARGRKHEVGEESAAADDTFFFVFRPLNAAGLKAMPYPLPQVAPRVIIVSIPQSCGTGTFGSGIKIIIELKISGTFPLKSA